MKKIILLLIIVMLTVFVSGCWDMMEINQTLFPYSVGIDLNEEEGDKYVITISYPNINAIGKNATQDERIYVVSTVSSSIFEGASQLATRLPHPFNFKMLKVLVVGNSISKDPDTMREILDGIMRDFNISKKVRIIEAHGDAKDILLFAIQAKRQEVIEGTLFSMLMQKNNTDRYNSQTVTNFVSNMDMRGVSLVPRVTTGEEDIKVYGGCIFKDYKLIGHLNELENRAVAFIEGESERDLIDVPFEGITVSYMVTGSESRRELIKSGENLKIKISIQLEGALQEYIHKDNPPENGLELLKNMELAIEKELQKQIDETMDKLQKEYNADVIGINEYLSKFHPKIWREVEKDWDELFPELEIEIVLDAKIRRRGLLK